MVAEHEAVSYGPFDLEFVAVNHSIPDAMAVMIRTGAGNVLVTGDFKIDSLPIDGRITDLRSFARFGDEGVDLFCVDSTNAEVPGMIGHENQIGPVLDNVFAESDQQIIVASFSSHVHRVQQVLDAAALHGRRVALVGRSMVRNMGIAAERGYLRVPDGVLVDARDVASLPPDERVLMATGSQGEPMAALSRMAHGEHRSITLEPGDTVIFASSLIPARELRQPRHQPAHAARCARHPPGNAKVHVSGHASSEELLHVYNIVGPRNVMPIHGEVRHLVANGALAVKTGVAPGNVILAEDGVVVDLLDGCARIAGAVPCGYVYVDGSSIGEIDETSSRIAASWRRRASCPSTPSSRPGAEPFSPARISRPGAWPRTAPSSMRSCPTSPPLSRRPSTRATPMRTPSSRRCAARWGGGSGAVCVVGP